MDLLPIKRMQPGNQCLVLKNTINKKKTFLVHEIMNN